MVRSIHEQSVHFMNEEGAKKPKGILERLSNGLEEIAARQARLEALLAEIRDGMESSVPRKEFYTTAEAAAVLGKATFTVRQWARLGRIHAEKTHSGRGLDAEWRISHREIERIRNEGLLPIPTRY